MPLTDSEATADSFYIGIVGLVLAGIEALLIWWRRFRNALIFFELKAPSYQPPTESEYSNFKTLLDTAEGRAATAETLLKTEREAHQTAMDSLKESHRKELELQKVQNELLVTKVKLKHSQGKDLRKVQDKLLVAETKLDSAQREARRERRERMLLFGTLRPRRQRQQRP